MPDRHGLEPHEGEQFGIRQASLDRVAEGIGTIEHDDRDAQPVERPEQFAQLAAPRLGPKRRDHVGVVEPAAHRVGEGGEEAAAEERGTECRLEAVPGGRGNGGRPARGVDGVGVHRLAPAEECDE